jgi:predicted MFS family arabinose efflux permease
MARPEDRGRVVGTVMSGLLIGILLARTLAGLVASISSWRAMFGLAAVMMLVLSVVLWQMLPRRAPNASLTYPEVLRSILTLVRHEPLLRRRALYGALGFAGFSGFWTTVTFLLAGSPYRYSTLVIGLFGLLGAAGASMASVAGRLADAGRVRWTTGGFAVAIVLSFLLMGAAGTVLVVLVVGILLVDGGVQGLHITNQSVIYRLSDTARSRITTAYMTTCFAGTSAGSAVAVLVYSLRGWSAVCMVGGALGLLIVALWALERQENV